MTVTKKIVIIVASVLVLLIGGGVAYATYAPTSRLERQINLGNKYLEEGKYQEAILAFHKVIEIEPKNIIARLGLGKVYVAIKDYRKAESVLKEVIGIDHNNLQANNDLFYVYLIDKDIDAATTVLKDIIKTDPNIDVNEYLTKLETAQNKYQADNNQGNNQLNDNITVYAKWAGIPGASQLQLSKNKVTLHLNQQLNIVNIGAFSSWGITIHGGAQPHGKKQPLPLEKISGDMKMYVVKAIHKGHPKVTVHVEDTEDPNIKLESIIEIDII